MTASEPAKPVVAGMRPGFIHLIQRCFSSGRPWHDPCEGDGDIPATDAAVLPTVFLRQFADPTSGALAHLVASRPGGEAVVVDPAPGLEELILAVVREQALGLRHVLLTHIHEEGAFVPRALVDSTGASLVAGAKARWAGECRRVRDGDRLDLDGLVVRVIETPGHTPGCVSYLVDDRLFCGDAIGIADCAEPARETDLGLQYDSVTRRVFGLPDETLVYPSHDRRGRTVTTVGEERRANRAFAGLTREAFLTEMSMRAGTGAEWRRP